ncbi:MAG TPA: hypothetical protein VL326_11925 [Kofleriaceae bacterium]|nr:hypothetical protein [Kofleriaceae bacterium]
MTGLRPCTACRRHVRVDATACPFCSTALPPGRAMYTRPGAITRAAVFSAALAGCSDHKQPPAPHAGSAPQGSDDLEQLLDDQPRTAEHPMRDAAPVDAAVQVAQPIDAGPPVDAGVDQQALAEKKRRAEERRRKLEEQRRLQEQLQLEQLRNDHINAKPYGAPPARRRVV